MDRLLDRLTECSSPGRDSSDVVSAIRQAMAQLDRAGALTRDGRLAREILLEARWAVESNPDPSHSWRRLAELRIGDRSPDGLPDEDFYRRAQELPPDKWMTDLLIELADGVASLQQGETEPLDEAVERIELPLLELWEASRVLVAAADLQRQLGPLSKRPPRAAGSDARDCTSQTAR